MNKILGLDLGTNSIGWALIDNNKILAAGSRIVPMGAEVKNFEAGKAQTKNADRRTARGIRKLNKRYKQRRNKLIYVLKELEMLPEQFLLSNEFGNPNLLQKISILPITKETDQLTALQLFELRAKALHEKIELKDLGRIFYQFNQLRGYSGGGEDEIDDKQDNMQNEPDEEQKIKNRETVIEIVKITSALTEIEYKKQIDEKTRKEKKKYAINILRSNGEELEGETFLDKLIEGDEEELQIEIRRNKKGDITSVNIKLPVKTSWRKDMEDFDKNLEESNLFPGEFLYNELKNNKWYKVRKKVILRYRLQDEFDAIWKEQSKHHAILNSNNNEIVKKIATFLFPGTNTEFNQEKYRNEAMQGGLYHIIRNQIIYYQRDLKDQSHLIGKCQFEKEEKVVPKSHPIYQEFKVWEQINKLSINTKKEIEKRGKIVPVYEDKLTTADFKAELFDELQDKKEIGFSSVYKKLALRDKIDFLNGLNYKLKLKGNETKLFLKKNLGQELYNQLQLNKPEILMELWQILYSGKGNEYDINSDRNKAILSFLKKQLPATDLDFSKKAIEISKIKFKRAYGSLSVKAIEKILPLMRAGKHYLFENIVAEIKEKLDLLHDGKLYSAHELAAQEHVEWFPELIAEGGMMYPYATTIVYGQHTTKELKDDDVLKDYRFIQPIEPGTLRNPIAEQMVNETLQVVKAIWMQHGKPEEIRIELARELKNNADERSKMSSAIEKNRKVNEKIKERLIELKQETSLGNIERYKLWSSQESEKGIAILSDPSKDEIAKMRLWEEQGLVSPYTGKPIPLSQLFDKGLYDIDHIIPKSRFFDDSLANKVVCERIINDDKGNRTSWEYFEIGSTDYTILTQEQFIGHVNHYFHGRKRKNLLARQIPKDFLERQKKDTQYISIKVKEELAKIVGTSNVKTTTGGVTDYLKLHWGLTEKFKELTKSRYETAKPLITIIEYNRYKKKYDDNKKNAQNDNIPFNEELASRDEFIKEFTKNYITEENNRLKIKGWSKRIDQRHHALDAIVIACTEQSHIQRLNNLNKVLQDWIKEHKDAYLNDFNGTDEEMMESFLNLDKKKREKALEEIGKSFRKFEAPWKGFVDDVEKQLEKIIVSIKPKQKLLIQKVQKGQDKGRKDYLKVRGEIHESTIYGISNGKESYRVELKKFAGTKFATEKAIEKIVDELLKEEIKNHFAKYKKDKKEAFSAEGIKDFNTNREIPVIKVKIYYKNNDIKIKLGKLGQEKSNTKELIDLIIDENEKAEITKHLERYENDKSIAFSKDGIIDFNTGREKPIKSLKLKNTESESDEEDNITLQRLDRKLAYNEQLFVKTGDNYAFAILEKEGKRLFDIISFFDATNLAKDSFKHGETNIDKVISDYFSEQNKGTKIMFMLKQNDLVYMPSKDEEIIIDTTSPLFDKFWNDTVERSKKVYAVVKYSKKQIYFIKHDVADVIEKGVEFGSQNCYEKINGMSIKEYCIKLNVDRLGNIKPA